jgi:hypothetical protein
MPTVKMTQGFSRFGREPTQKGDKGYAVPGGYYMGGVSAYAGGNTSFYPRANLSTLSFQPVANLKAPKRDYDQHHETGGPNGWVVKTMEKQQEENTQGSQSPSTGNGGSSGNGSGSSPSPAMLRTQMRLMEQRNFMAARGMLSKGLTDVISGSSGGLGGTGTNGTSGSGSDSSQQQDDKTQFSFDKDGLATIQSKDAKHLITVDGKNKQITLQVPNDETIYVGGDGKTGKYAKLVTTGGPVINAQGRIG